MFKMLSKEFFTFELILTTRLVAECQKRFSQRL
ncbi:Uncharacterised protein [Vibrio cholerae]|uniref:Uncharacterized protein n=1 Tax=Vibrio cholerae TaxID=666 RepID=A0A655X2F8_VIBCL|nr:Uncharacterised protein [Vibrio cholerae]CSB91692.1 Uncharacterised protein [Vibrio cholerae]CSC04319.1 Uncharacterised protein [Vibrio cholerae]CSI55341.1 Uncharacterised protein [Vibrio cholerae]